MFNFKEEIAKKLEKIIELEYTEIINMIETPKEKNMGDYAFPCFRLAKVLKKAPQIIANDINEKLNISEGDFIEKTEVVNRIFKLLYRQKQNSKISTRRI